MRSRIVEEVVRRGPAELAGRARALVPRTGNLAHQLLELGYPAAAILDGAAAATGVRAANPAWLREPKPPPIDYDDGLLFRQVGAAPVAVENGELCVAYGDPAAAAEATLHGLPPHRPYLALPAQLARALALLPSEPTMTEAVPTAATRRAAFAVRSQAPNGIEGAFGDGAAAGDDALDDALDGVSEATRTVPGGAPPMPRPAEAKAPDDDAPETIGMNLAELQRVAHLSNQGKRAGPASDEGAGFEELRTEQVDLVSPAGRAAVEATVTATASTPQAPSRRSSPKTPQRSQPALRLPTAKAEDDDDYEDVATVALTKGALEALMAPAAPKPPTAPSPAPAPAPDDDGDEGFDDPTEHVAVLASREQLVTAKAAPKRPTGAVPLTDPGPAATPRRPTPLPRAPTRPPQPSQPPPSRRPAQDPVELGATQPMPRHQPATEMEVVPVPVARRGPSPLASALSSVGKPVAAEPPPARMGTPPPRVPTPPARAAEPPSAEQPQRASAGFSSRHIPGFDEAPPPLEPRRTIPGFDEHLEAPAPARKGRVMLLHPPDSPSARVSVLQDTEAAPQAPGPAALDPSELDPVAHGGDDAPMIGRAQPDQAASLDFIDERERDFSRPPLPLPAPPPRAAPPLRFPQRPPPGPSVVEELDARAGRRGGGAAGGLQVLRAGAPPPPSAGLEVEGDGARPTAPQPFIPGIDSAAPSFGDAPAVSANDRRSKQILIAATVIAVGIILSAVVLRARATRTSTVPVATNHAASAPVEVPPVPPPPPPVADTAALGAPPTAQAASTAGIDGAGASAPPIDAAPAARQSEIIEEARRLSDPAMAIGMYSQAIELDPQSIAARDALFERAKLHLATGDREHARADVQKLRRRADAKDLERDLQLILDGANAAGGGP